MNIFNLFLKLFVHTFINSATPNFFAANKRRKEKEKIAADYRSTVDTGFEKSQSEINKQMGSIAAENPFESAAAKSAMATASRKAKQTQQRFANMMGSNASPEAMVAAQQATQEAIAGSAGDIAAGAEAQKQSRLDTLGAEKRMGRDVYAGQVANAGQMRSAAVAEYGQGWKDFFSNMNSAAQLAGSIGGAIAGI